jgi:signal transduction histidine kinase/ActR/RegA family two-component response regulator
MSDEWVRGVVDDSGVVVARSRDPERFVGQNGTLGFVERLKTADSSVYRDVALDGTTVYGAFSRAPVSRWIAGVAVPAAVVDASFRRSMMALAMVAMLLLGVGGAGAYLISRGIADDIRQSATDAEAIAGGLRPAGRRSAVTEIQRLLDALSRSASLLETRQRERDEQLARADAARASAEAADRAKDQFLAMLGHELRNPLAPALTALHLMKLRGGEQGTRERDVIERQIRHMSRLVDDLLDVSRLQRGAIELRRERFDLAEAVARAVEMTSPAFAEKQQRLDVVVSRGLVVDADPIRIAQVLGNLLMNAAKYTERGGHVELRVHDEGGFAVIECCDNGMGMPPDLVPRVFDLFVQGERGIDRQQGGLGLGLAVARTLVQLHGGTIEATSAGVNRGSTFTVRLPLAPAVAVAPSAVTATRTAAIDAPDAVGSVLVVDDNRDALEMLLLALQHSGLSAVGAVSAAEALDLAERLHPTIAVLDIGLPGMDGFELARELRSRLRGRPIRLIALTGYGREPDIAAAGTAGFDAFFVKPVEIEALVGALSVPIG